MTNVELSLNYFLQNRKIILGYCSLHLCQSKYILDVLHRARIVGAKLYAAPCVSGSKLSSLSGEPLSALTEVSEYRSVVGALQYCLFTDVYMSLFWHVVSGGFTIVVPLLVVDD
jgi:hypothetical protein